MKFWQSIRYRFLFALLIGGLAVTLAGTIVIHDNFLDQGDHTLAFEGRSIATVLNHASMVADNNAEIQHVVEEVFRETKNLFLILIIEEGSVVASSEVDWINKPVSDVPNADILKLLSDNTDHNDHEHSSSFKWNNQPAIAVSAPLSVTLSEHTHAHSEVVTGYRDSEPVVTMGVDANEKHSNESVLSQDAMHDDAQIEDVNHRDTHSHEASNHDSLKANVKPSWQLAEAADVRGEIIILMDMSGSIQQALSNAFQMANGYALGILFTMLLSFFLMSRLVLKPLKIITNTMKNQKKGLSDSRAVLSNSNNELARVALELNTMLDVQKNHEVHLRQLSQAVEQSPTAVIITDTDGIIEYVNKQYCLTSGYSSEELIGQKPSIVKSGLTPPEIYESLWESLASGKPWKGEIHNKSKSGNLYWEDVVIAPIFNKQQEIVQYMGLKEDITLRKIYEEKLIRQANYDDLTELPNRILAQDRLKQAMAVANRAGRGHKVALLLLDLDDFKNINDTMGHDIGDQLLKEVANRFHNIVRETDTVARFGGDEFIIIMTDVTASTDVECLADKLLQQLVQPFNLGGMNFIINASIGIALYPDDSKDVQHLMQDADAALNRAKQEGRGRYSFFLSKMNQEAVEHMQLEQALQKALERNELEVHFQPVINCVNGRIVGAEALLRWQHPELGSIPPFKFIPLAERSNLIQGIGSWVLRESCRAAARWVEVTGGEFRIAVNLSAKQFGCQRLLNDVDKALQDSQLLPKYLELEFTESVLMREDDETSAEIQALHDKGIRFAIDDFGTGYSSISYLRQYPFDTLKIDRSFVTDLISNSNDAKLVNSILAMADSLQLEVLAEGIEQSDQFDYLRGIGTARCQGWLFSKAMPEADFSRFLSEWTPEQYFEHNAEIMALN